MCEEGEGLPSERDPYPIFPFLPGPHFPTSLLGEDWVETPESTLKPLSFTDLRDMSCSLQGAQEEYVQDP